MKSHSCFFLNKLSPGRANISARLFMVLLYGSCFDLPALDLNLQNTINFYGNPKIAQRLSRDISPSSQQLVARASASLIAPKAGFHKYHSREGHYLIKDLGSLGGTESFADSINNHGAVTGLSRTQGDTETHPFIYLKGKMIDLTSKIEVSQSISINNADRITGGITINDLFVPAIYDFKMDQTKFLGTLGGATSFGFNGTATANNDVDQTVGYSYLDGINRHAFFHEKNGIHDLGSLGGYSSATAINKFGVITGFSSNSVTGRAHAFVFANGNMKDINPISDPTFQNSESYARDINVHGEVVGEFLTPDQSAFHAFINKNGKVTKFNLKGSPLTTPFSINKRGKVVGIMDVPYKSTCPGSDFKPVPCTKFKQHAFLYRKGRIIDLNRLISKKIGWELSWALDINDKDQIVGYGIRGGKSRAFLLSRFH